MKKPLTYLIRQRDGTVITGTIFTEPGEIIQGIQSRIDDALCIAGGVSSPFHNEPGTTEKETSHGRK